MQIDVSAAKLSIAIKYSYIPYVSRKRICEFTFFELSTKSHDFEKRKQNAEDQMSWWTHYI